MTSRTREDRPPPANRNGDLAGKYRKIGITAVAAAVAYQGARSNSEEPTEQSDLSPQEPRSGAKPRRR
jgi:hypothetical protein